MIKKSLNFISNIFYWTCHIPYTSFQMVDWPLVGPDNAAVDLDCYVQLDSEFVAKALLFKLHATARLSERPCAIRIPTGSRITVVEMGPVEEGHTVEFEFWLFSKGYRKKNLLKLLDIIFKNYIKFF